MTRAAWPFLLAMACHPQSRAQPLAPAGATGADKKPADDGAGELARLSSRLLTSDQPDAPTPGMPRRPRRADVYADPYAGDPYGGAGYGGAAYGGATYANYRPPTWGYTTPNRVPKYAVQNGLVGAVEGTVSWAGAAPPRISTACGMIDNPSVRVTNHGVEGVLVYIERVVAGRQINYSYGRPASVGGTVIKRGCALTPAIQIATPLPALLSIHGDTTRTRVRVTQPAGAVKPFDLQEGGRIQLPITTGMTRVEGDDGTLSSAWVLALDTPYYAITDEQGHFRLDELAAGTYDVMFWQAPLAATNPDGRIVYGPPVTQRKTIVVTDKAAHLDATLGKGTL